MNVLGPSELWAGSVGDADILKNTRTLPWLNSFFASGDNFVLDRGFEHVKEELDMRGFKVSIPPTKHGNAQFSALEANQSRVCAEVRWVVEWTKSSIKRFEQITNPVNSNEIPHLYDDVKILCAIHNAFFSRQFSDCDDADVVHLMLAKMCKETSFSKLLNKKTWCVKVVIFKP